MTDKPKKVRHTSRSLERHVRAPREHTWTVMLDLIEAGRDGGALEGEAFVETVLSLEPPWRRSYKLEGDHGLDLYEGTFVLRDDGDECHVSWGLVVDPEPTPAGWAFVDLALGVIRGFLARLAEAAEADAA